MICTGCKKKFYLKRGLFDLFNTKTYYICDKCLGENPINLKIDYLMLNNNDAIIISLLKRKPKFSYDAYINEMSYVLSKYIVDDRYYLVFIDELYPSLSNLEILDLLSSVTEKKILILTYYRYL